MKNNTFNSRQYAIVKRTLNLEEFVMNYLAPNNIHTNDLNMNAISDN